MSSSSTSTFYEQQLLLRWRKQLLVMEERGRLPGGLTARTSELLLPLSDLISKDSSNASSSNTSTSNTNSQHGLGNDSTQRKGRAGGNTTVVEEVPEETHPSSTSSSSSSPSSSSSVAAAVAALQGEWRALSHMQQKFEQR